MALFKKGYEAAREEKKRQEEAREQMGKRLFRFFLSGDGAEARVRFLTEEPINFNEHTVKTYRGGKERYDSVLCSGDDSCPHCEDGDKPSFKGAFLIWDYSEYESKDKNGKKKKVRGSLKLYVAGTRVLSQLDRLSNRYGLTSRDYEISRTGTGTDTSYMIERTDEVSKLTRSKIESMLPEKLKEEFDGTIESLYTIVEEQLKMYLPDFEEKDDKEYKKRKNLVSDDDEDDDFDEDDEDTDDSDFVDLDDEEEDDDVPFDGKHKSNSLKRKPLGKSTLSRGKKTSIKGVFKK